MAPPSQSPISPLSAAAEDVIEALDRSVRSGDGPPNDPSRWLTALIQECPEALGGSHNQAQLDAIRELVEGTQHGGDSFSALLKEEVATQAGLRAGKENRPIASSQDVAWAVLSLVVEKSQAARNSGERRPLHEATPGAGFDSDAVPDPTDEDLPPFSMATEEMLEGLSFHLGLEAGESAGVFRWLEILLTHHEIGVDGEGGEGKLEGLKEWGTAREASNCPIPLLTRRQVRTGAGRYAQETGQPLVTPQHVAIAVVKFAMEVFTSARDQPSTPSKDPSPGPDESTPVTEAPTPEPSPEASSAVPGTGATDHQQTRTFRLFVSSTFKDLKEERNALQEMAFGPLEDFCAQRGARFQAIDLRWGVSEEAGVDQQTMNICLGEIERCHQVTPRPNFLVLLGDRYGWIPPPAQIPADEFEEILERLETPEERETLGFWYRKDLNAVPPEYRLLPRTGNREAYRPWDKWAPVERLISEALRGAVGEEGLNFDPERQNLYRASATEQEVWPGALNVAEPADRVFCFFREITNPPDGVGESLPEEAGDFFSAEPNDGKRLRELKERLRKHLPEECILERRVDWRDQGPELTEAYLVGMAEWVRESLEQAILRELERPVTDSRPGIRLPETVMREPALAGEVSEHLRFAEERRRFFVGREEILGRIDNYIRGDSASPLAILGEGGSGKSALVAEAVRRVGNEYTGIVPVVRFVGATPGSSDGRVLLESLSREIALRYGEDPGEMPNEYNDLIAKLGEQLDWATPEHPLVLWVDSLDQLTQPASGLTWIPSPLPPHVRLVVSSRPEDMEDRLKGRGATLIPLGPLTRGNGEELLQSWLAAANPPRSLQPFQEQAILESFLDSHGNPLYLKLATEEARKWPSWWRLGADAAADPVIKPLAKGVRGIIRENLFSRLAHDDNHGWNLVSRAMGYLSASRYGLAEDELIQLLSRDPDVYGWFLLGAEHMPPDLVKKAHEHWSPPLESPEGDSPDRPGEDSAFRLKGRRDRSTSRLKELRENPENLRAFLEEEIGLDDIKLPVVIWSRLLFDLHPYLTERRAEGGNLLSFFHKELGDVAAQMFLFDGPGEEQDPPMVTDGARGRIAEEKIHGRLADFFRSKADPDGDQSWEKGNIRGLSELPCHLTHAGRWDEVYEVLTDFAFLEQKAARVGVVKRSVPDGEPESLYSGVFQLQDDFDLALRKTPGGGAVETREHPLIVTALDFGEGFVVRCPWCNALHPLRQDWLGEEISCPNGECGGPLKVNAFTAGNPFEGQVSFKKPESGEHPESPEDFEDTI